LLLSYSAIQPQVRNKTQCQCYVNCCRIIKRLHVSGKWRVWLVFVTLIAYYAKLL